MKYTWDTILPRQPRCCLSNRILCGTFNVGWFVFPICSKAALKYMWWLDWSFISQERLKSCESTVKPWLPLVKWGWRVSSWYITLIKVGTLHPERTKQNPAPGFRSAAAEAQALAPCSLFGSERGWAGQRRVDLALRIPGVAYRGLQGLVLGGFG